MLFDLRGRHRRRLVRVVYVGLALLIGLGLVGFGIGGGFGSGGLFTAATNNEGQNGASRAKEIKRYTALTRRQPNNVGAWEKLANAIIHETGNGETYVNSQGVTAKGKEYFHRAAQAWSSYLALNPPKPNPSLALQMATVYSEGGLNEPDQAVQALQIAVAARPTSAALWGALAQYAYKAHNTRVGDLASTKAVALAPPAERARIKQELALLKANPSGEQTYTGTTNGKTVTGKLNSKGEIKATEVKTSTAPAGTSTGASK
jgi:hypothetical protein